MATRKKKMLPTRKTPKLWLMIDQRSFADLLKERVDLGKAIADRPGASSRQVKTTERQYRKWDEENLKLLEQSFTNPHNKIRQDYDAVNFFLSQVDYNATGFDPKDKRLKKFLNNKIEFLETLMLNANDLRSKANSTLLKRPDMNTSSFPAHSSIFIVHGRNTSVLHNVARTIEKLGLNPIILHEHSNAGDTIIEKIETYSNVGFAIILLTGDDEGKLKANADLKDRACQDVVWEFGYFTAKLGRKRVLPLYVEGVELPSDVNGLLYTPIDKGESWKWALAKELRSAGYTIDANTLL